MWNEEKQERTLGRCAEIGSISMKSSLLKYVDEYIDVHILAYLYMCVYICTFGCVCICT
jgi:hypothetical protein